jgi:hypothetical protein
MLIKNQEEQTNLLKQHCSSSIIKEKIKDDQWADASIICEFLCISTDTLKKYRENKVITTSKFAGKMLYNLSEVKRSLKRNSTKAII